MSNMRDVTVSAQKYLNQDEILLFIGPRQAGKTTILKQLQDSLKERKELTFSLNLEDPDYLTLLNDSPKNLFKIFTLPEDKKSFVFIDEIQYLNDPSRFLKYFYDEFKGRIKILASGSSAFYLDEKFKDSLAGRKKIFYVHTLSFKEFLRFKKYEELSGKDFHHLSLNEKETLGIQYYEFMTFGGYPRIVLAPVDEKKELIREIAYSYIKKDILEAGVRQEDIFYKLFKILASQIGQMVNASELAKTLGVSKSSIDHYLYVMQKSFHVQLLKPFSRNMRKELVKMPKIFFIDLGLRNFFVNNFQSFDLREDKGRLLENAVFRQLLERPGEIRFWRTTGQHEIDFIFDEQEAFEVKVNLRQFRARPYKVFLEEYPNIRFSIVTIDVTQKTFDNFNVLEAWNL